MNRIVHLAVIAAAVLGVIRIETGDARSQPAVAAATRPFVTWWGAHSRMDKAGYFRVTSDEEWKRLWALHAGEQLETPYKIAKYPEVDFEQCMVVMVFAGKTSNTRGLAVASASEEPDRIRFRFEGASLSYQTGPQADEVTPYVLCVLPRSTKPLVIEEDVRSLKNEGPRWKERARFERL